MVDIILIIFIVEQSRRDDLEAVGYVLMYFLRGSLPWQGLKVNKNEDKYKKIYDKKKSTSAEDLCRGYQCIINIKYIAEFCEYIKYCRNLGFETEPDYNYLRGLLKKVMIEKNLESDFKYDWVAKFDQSEKEFKHLKDNVRGDQQKIGNIKHISSLINSH